METTKEHTQWISCFTHEKDANGLLVPRKLPMGYDEYMNVYEQQMKKEEDSLETKPDEDDKNKFTCINL